MFGRVADGGTQVAVGLIMLGTLLAGYETLNAEVGRNMSAGEH